MTTPIHTIGIFAPSSAIAPDRFEAGLKILHDRGYQTLVHPQTYEGVGAATQYNSSDAGKITAYKDLSGDSSVDLIMAATGGNRACFLLPEWNSLGHGKPLMGFSDTTALLAALYKDGLDGYFGPTVQTLAHMDQAHLDLTFDLFDGMSRTIPLPDSFAFRNGQATAPVFAATLSVLCALTGTPYFPDLTGHILILEDIGEELSRIDRMIWQLSQIIPFERLAGLVFGQFADCQDTGTPYGESLNGILQKHAAPLSIPILGNAPIDHKGRIFPILTGRTITLDATNRCLIFT